jgi:ACS family hexuronate transporter-like MFS transporter
LAATLGYNPLFVCLMLFDIIGATVAWKLITHGESSAPAHIGVPAELAEQPTSGR